VANLQHSNLCVDTGIVAYQHRGVFPTKTTISSDLVRPRPIRELLSLKSWSSERGRLVRIPSCDPCNWLGLVYPGEAVPDRRDVFGAALPANWSVSYGWVDKLLATRL